MKAFTGINVMKQMIEQFQMSAVKPKPKLLLWRMTTDVNSAVNQIVI